MKIKRLQFLAGIITESDYTKDEVANKLENRVGYTGPDKANNEDEYFWLTDLGQREYKPGDRIDFDVEGGKFTGVVGKGGEEVTNVKDRNPPRKPSDDMF